MTCNKHSGNCGCSEEALSTNYCDDPVDCGKEPCSEVFCEECIAHCQYEMSIDINGNSFVIKKGARLDEVIQRLLIALSNEGGIEAAPVGVRVRSVSDTTILIQWIKVGAATYNVNWTDGVTPGVAAAGAVDQYEITNLTPDTEYSIYIADAATLDASVVVKVKTNA